MPDKRKILVVDDDPIIRSLLRHLLEKAGYQVLMAADGVQATMMARTTKPHCIILDIMMPAGDGFAVLERIHQMIGTMSIPVVIHSSLSQADIMKRIQAGPGTPILQKPAAAELILETIKTAIEEG